MVSVADSKSLPKASEITAKQKANKAAEQLFPKLKLLIEPHTKVLSAFAGPEANRGDLELELTLLALHVYDRLCHECMPPNLRHAFVDTLVYAFLDSHSMTVVDEQQAEFRVYFLTKLDERQIYYGKAGDLFAGRGRHSVIRKFAEMMHSFYPNMDVVATSDVAKEFCLAIRGSLLGPFPTSEKGIHADKVRTMMSSGFWILVAITLVLSTKSTRLAGSISGVVAAAGLFVGLYGKRASREPDVDPQLGAFEVVFAQQFIHLGLWMGIVSGCIWAIVLIRGL